MTRLPIIRHIRALLMLARCARYRHDDTLGWLCDVWRGER